MTEVRFVGEEYDGIESMFGDLAGKLETIANDCAVSNYGESALLHPSVIKISPEILEKPVFFVSAWHETEGAKQSGRLQYNDFVLRMGLIGEHAFLSTEDNKHYPLSTRETLLLSSVSNLAVVKALLDIPPNES